MLIFVRINLIHKSCFFCSNLETMMAEHRQILTNENSREPPPSYESVTQLPAYSNQGLSEYIIRIYTHYV